MYLLDTNACIKILNDSSRQLVAKFRSKSPSEVRLCSVVKAELEPIGRPIGANGLMIASIAVANDVTLVTHNTDEFIAGRGIARKRLGELAGTADALEGLERLLGLGTARVVCVHPGVADDTTRVDDISGRQRQRPAIVSVRGFEIEPESPVRLAKIVGKLVP